MTPLRPDHLGCYGYPRNTSPNLDRLAQEGIRFERYYTSDAPCLPSRAALQTGMFGIRTIHDGFRLFDEEMLFNITQDPHEQFDVKDDHPDICAQGARIILNWTEAQMKKGPQMIDPMWTVMREGGPYHIRGALAGYLQRLENTGRAEGAKRLREKHGERN